MIVLFTDFGANDLYTGQVKAVLLAHAPGVPVIDLLHDAPSFNVKASAHLLAALSLQFPQGAVFFAVVDPGVGGARDAVVMEADEKWYVGPDNGLLSVIAARARSCKFWRITWTPGRLSASFHGRDLFAPVAGLIAKGEFPHDKLEATAWLYSQLGEADLAEVIYIDHYGNAITGFRAGSVPQDAQLLIHHYKLRHARVFSEVGKGEAFWHENSIGLAEIAVNCGSAALELGLKIGQGVICFKRL